MNNSQIRNIAIMDTSIMSFNIGDQIIMESARGALMDITKDAFVVNMPTHSPLFHWYEFSLRNTDSFQRALDSIDLKIVCGTNCLEKDMKKRKNAWNIHYRDLKYFNDYVLMAIGTDEKRELANNYTKKLYQKALSHKYIHSTRDEKTKQFLELLGFRAVNTGCVTLWQLSEEHCVQIPRKKANTVVFTVTDYMPDPEKDQMMINNLCEAYENVYCWLQGIMDEKYIKSLKLSNEIKQRIQYIAPSLFAYNTFLANNDCDYVGTRLHAGIKAMQLKKRTLIIGVDNRARDMHETYDIPLLERDELASLKEVVNSDYKISIKLNRQAINTFLNQF